MPRIVFVEQFFFPEGWAGAQLPRDVASHLRQSGYEVEVICGSDQYAELDGEAQPDPRESGVKLKQIPKLIRGDFKRLKFLRQLWFYAAAAPLLVFRRSPDVFVAQTNPPLIVPMVAFAAWLHRRPHVIITQDLYPEVIFAHGMMREEQFIARILKSLFGLAYRSATQVVSLGPTMSEKLRTKGVPQSRIQIISNWATGNQGIARREENQLIPKWSLDGQFVILYSGNLGISHDVETPIRAVCKALKQRENIRLVFVGTGHRLDEARKLVSRLDLGKYVQFHGLVPSELLPHSIGIADIALVTLRPGFEGLVVPSKLLGYMARGIPTIYVGPPSDVRQTIATADCGICVANSDYENLGSEILRLANDKPALKKYGYNAKRYYEQQVARDIGLQTYLELMNGVVSRSSQEASLS